MSDVSATTPPAESTDQNAGKKRVSSVGFFIFILCGFGALGYVALHPKFYDAQTTKISEQVSRFTPEEWKRIYDESLPLFEKNKETARQWPNGKLPLKHEDLPPSVKELGYDKFYVTGEGVSYDHIGSGAMLNFTYLRLIYEPGAPGQKRDDAKSPYRVDSRDHDRKGIWFRGVQEWRWVYEVK